MRRISIATVAVLVLVGTVAAVPAAGLVQSSDDGAASAQTAANESNASVAPGERLSGVVGVGEAELEGEVESRAFGLAVARADSDEARADLIAQKVNESRERVENLSERREQLREARENGSISQGQYAARIAELAARSDNVQRTANDTANASEGLPAELLESKGVNASAIQQLRDNARNLTGQEVAEVARSIAGERPEQADRGADRGTDADRGGASDGDDATPTDGDMDGERTPDDDRTTDDGMDGERTPDDERTTDDDMSDEQTTDGDTDTDAGGNRGGGSDRGGR
jgi:hypothetical protein